MMGGPTWRLLRTRGSIDNGPEGLLLFVRRDSGEGAYTLTVRAYTAYRWYKVFPAPVIALIVGDLAILGILVLLELYRVKTKTLFVDRSIDLHRSWWVSPSKFFWVLSFPP